MFRMISGCSDCRHWFWFQPAVPLTTRLHAAVNSWIFGGINWYNPAVTKASEIRDGGQRLVTVRLISSRSVMLSVMLPSSGEKSSNYNQVYDAPWIPLCWECAIQIKWPYLAHYNKPKALYMIKGIWLLRREENLSWDQLFLL